MNYQPSLLGFQIIGHIVMKSYITAYSLRDYTIFIVFWVLCTSTIMYYMHLLLTLRGFRLTRLFPGTKSRVNRGVSVL